MQWWEDQNAYYQSLGAARFIGLYAAMIAYLVVCVCLLTWLSDETGWPEAYGFRCHGRGCWTTYLWHSFDLLKRATFAEVALFALLWHLPAIVGALVLIVVGRRRVKRWKNRIRPME